MVKYIKQEMNIPDSNGKRKCYYRLQTRGNLSTKNLIDQIACPGSGLSKGTVMHVMQTMFSEMALSLSKGYSITLNGLGNFRATLGVREDKEMDTIDGNEQKRNSASIVVNGINFRPDRNLIFETDKHCRLSRGGISRLRQSPYSKEERLQIALNYLSNPETPFMRQDDYVRLTKQSRYKAREDLVEFRNDPDSGITCSGSGSSLIYHINRKVFSKQT